MRVGASQDCPLLEKQARVPARTAAAKSASGRMMFGDLPPSSWATRLTVSAAALATMMSGSGRAGEGHHVDVRMGRHHLPDIRARSVDQVEHARRGAGSLDDFGEQDAADGRDLARLQDDRASGGERRRDLADDLVHRASSTA